MKNMQLVILCGGLATRLGKLTKNVPKSMIRIDGRPFLEHQIDNVKKHGIADIVLCVSHLSESIEKYFGDGKNFGVHIQYSYDGDKLLGPIGALKHAESYLDDVFFSMYGDSYVFVDFENIYAAFLKENKLGMMTAYQNFDKIDTSNLVILDGKVVKYNNGKTKDMTFIDYGTSVFRKKALDIVPKNVVFSTKDFYSKLIAADELLAFKVKKRFYHIGDPLALEDFQTYIKNQKN